jgi:dTDP-4-dehydrorhamnose reductase
VIIGYAREALMKVLVTGAKGMLGSDLCPIFAQHHHVLATDLEEIDVRHPTAVMKAFKEFRPELVLHLAALTNVDGCQQNKDEAFLTNAVGTKNVSLACAQVGAAIVYISTGSVFDGTGSEPYSEFDTPNPQSEYSKAKYQGELMVKELVRKHYIVRAGWMFGGGDRDKKFVGKIIALANRGQKLQVVDDKFGSPTYTRDMARGILRLVETGWYGTYHMANTGCCSRFEYACKVVELAGIDSCPMEPVSSDAFPLPAPRPRMEAIRNHLLQLLGLDWMRPWEEALEDYIVNHLRLEDDQAEEG